MQLKRFFTHEWTLILLSYLALILLITWPLITGLGSVVLPARYPDLSHSDHAEHWGELTNLIYRVSHGAAPFQIDKSDMNHVYLWLGLFFSGVLGMPVPVFFNLYYLLTLLMAGVFTYLFIKDLTRDRLAAWFAGVLYMTSVYIPYAYYWGHSNTTQIQWIPLLFLCLERLLREPTIKNGVGLGIVAALQLFSSTQVAVYASVILPLYLLIRLAMRKSLLGERRFWRSLGAALITVVVVSLPYLLAKLRYHAPVRTIAENLNPDFRLEFVMEVVHPAYHLSLGILQWFLVLVALYLLVRHYRERQEYLPYAFLFLFVLVCMIGPVSPFYPYYWLYKAWPLIDHMRVPFRMYGFFLLSAVTLITLPLQRFKNAAGTGRHYRFLILVLFLVVLFQILTSPWLSGLHLI